jgi:DNA polymerase elongation subunit (family B)
MDCLRGDNPINLKENNRQIKFQILDWVSVNEVIEPSEEEEKQQNPNKNKFQDNKKYVIKAFGVTMKGNTVSINIHDFPPHYYINVPESWGKSDIDNFVKAIKSKLPKMVQNSITNYDAVKRKKFWGFTNNKLYLFVRLLFKNTQVMFQVNKILREAIPVLGHSSKKYEVYESNISPFLRFIHINNLLPAGWVQLEPYDYTINYERKSECQLDLDVHWKKVKLFESDEMSPFLTASFDIEADSSHGDFPLAKKDYKKLGGEILDEYQKMQKKNKRNVDLLERINYINRLITYAFGEGNALEGICNVFTKGNSKPNEKIIYAVAKKLMKILETKESYTLLVHDVFNNCDTDTIKDEFYGGEEITKLIEDGFAELDFGEEETKLYSEKSNSSIRKIFTKSNKKPRKSAIENIANKSRSLFEKIYSYFDEFSPGQTRKYIRYYIEAQIFDKMEKKVEYMLKKIDFVEEEDMKTLNYNIGRVLNEIINIFIENLPEIDASRDSYIKRITSTLNQYFPPVEGDKVIQIGTTIQKYGERDCYLKHIVTLGTCTDIEGCEVVQCETEADVLIAWSDFIRRLDPDIITGYNIFGFDFSYMWHRAEELDIIEDFAYLSRIAGQQSQLECKTLASSALGDNNLSYITMPGRVQMDLFKVIQRDHNLVSYKLDYVAETFINDSISSIDDQTLKIKGSINLNNGNFITINYGNGEKYMKNKKFKIESVDYDTDIIKLTEPIDNSLVDKKAKWQLAKDDVSPQDIFRLQKGDADDRKIVAVYCVMDCKLCLDIINKLDIITNNIGMANVCSVPVSYIFLRGQGVKIFSFVAKQCRKEKYLVPVIKHNSEERKVNFNELKPKFDYTEEDDLIVTDEDGGYEGAIVLKPQPGIYLDSPVSVLDYASLYPSSMISENLSHDSIILDQKYMGDSGIKELEKLGYGYVDVTYDVFKWVDPNIKSKGKAKAGVKTVRFAQPNDGSKGIIPRILQQLLKARKDTRKQIKYKTVFRSDGTKASGLLEKTDTEHIIKNVEGKKWVIPNDEVEKVEDTFNEFQKAVKDGFQLAYKITANSLYGQIGARTSPIYLKDIAASTTATGRKLLYLAKDKVEEKFDGAKIVYGDTDSVFVNYNPKDKDGNPLKGREALKASIELGVKSEEYIKDFLKPPHNLEYEKTFWPFILFSKKRYIGNKYEFDLDKYKQTSMGVVSKRRDNADIVKHVYNGVTDIIMNEKNIPKSIDFLKSTLLDLLNGKFNLDMLIITKSLRGYYKNPDQIAHKVLAERIGERDPGNKPASNDRIPYAYVEVKEKKGEKVLQSDRIEHPDYIREKKLKPDYKFYITNQIMKPVGQIFALIVEDLEGYNKPEGYFERKLKSLTSERGIEKAKNKITQLRHEEASELLFSEVIRIANNRRSKSREITDFFKIKKK